MKKFLTILAIATTTVTTILVTQGMAHEIRRCRNNHCLQARPTTNRIFSFDSYQLRRQIDKEARLAKNEGNKFEFWQNYKKQIAQPFDKKAYSVYKSTHSSLFPRYNNTLTQPHKIAVRETEYHQNYNWDSLKRINETIEASRNNFFVESGTGYVANIPTSFIKTDDGSLYDAQRDLNVNIQKETNHNCNGLSFQLCASQNLAESRENMTKVKNLSQKFGLRQVNMNGKTVLFPTYRETFTAGEYGSEQVYFSFSTMNSYNKNIVSLNGFAPEKNKFAATNLMNSIFQSIQL